MVWRRTSVAGGMTREKEGRGNGGKEVGDRDGDE